MFFFVFILYSLNIVKKIKKENFFTQMLFFLGKLLIFMGN